MISHVLSSHYDDQAFLIHQPGIILMMLYVVVERSYWLGFKTRALCAHNA
ncbi:hypothetical protein Hanom_Chr05g00426871 [Helianthus anomalus]